MSDQAAASRPWVIRAPRASIAVLAVVGVLTAVPTPGAAHAVTAPSASVPATTSVTWTDLTSTLARSPPSMNGQQMRYDPAIHRVLLFGGYDGSGLDATWTFSSSGWTELSPSASPPTENLGVMTYDIADQYMLLFGGNEGNVISDTGPTWVYHGGTWHQVFPAVAPSGRANAMMAYDAADGYVVLFGGCGPANTDNECQPLHDTWIFHAGAWTNVTAKQSTSPSARWDSAMAYSPSLKAVVLFGGCVKTVVVGGTCVADTNDLWEFKAGHWSNVTALQSGTPVARFGADLVYAPALGGLILFSGAETNGALLDDTQELQGTHWLPLHPSTGSPPARFRVRMAYYAPAGEVLLFAGAGAAGDLDDTWVLR